MPTTDRTVPASIIKRQGQVSAPPDPVAFPPAYTAPIKSPSDIAAIVTPVTISAVINPPVSVKLQDEVAEATALHQKVTAAISVNSPLIPAANTLSSALSTLSPGGLAVFSPILEDFRNTALEQINTDTSLNVAPSDVDSFISKVLSLSGSQRSALQTALSTAQTNTGNSAASRLQLEAIANNDLNIGYAKQIANLVTSCNLLATLLPRSWGSLATDFKQEGLSEVSNILNALYTSSYSNYADQNANALATHSILAQNSASSNKVLTDLQTTSFYLFSLQQIIATPDDPNLDKKIVSTIYNKAVSYAEKYFENILNNLESSLKKAL